MLNHNIDVIIPFHVINDFLHASINSVKASQKVIVRVIAVNDTGQNITKKDIQLEAEDTLITNFGRGYLDAMATGISQIKSEFVGFQDSDDFTDPYRFFNQLKYLQDHNLDLVTGQIIKVDSIGRSTKNKSIFGVLPSSLTPKQRLIFGSYGADSTIVAKSILVKTTWYIHKSFPQNLADYGWLLTILPNINIGHCREGVYYYRSHGTQMSRKTSGEQSWNKLRQLWIQNFISTLKDINYDATEIAKTLENYSKVSLAIAFPSTLPVLDKCERSILGNVITLLTKNLNFEGSEDNEALRILLFRRGFFATRGRSMSYLSQVFPIFHDFVLLFLKRIHPRFNIRI